ncbi:glycosyltransferase family 25 protein [Asaia prunellae]|uniref:glycosyltransferase family 25 protein n=1 Tax=Asaia prunellae TaxID=610245 RepID=UPI000AD90911|nr:glycosyltransferase family 25 protein [Asaia prunellae]
MDKYLISLERTPERTERFLAANAHIPDFIHAPGIDGSVMDIDAMKDLGLIHADCHFTRGAMGSGLTHVALWGAAAKNGRGAHIFEDDAFLCRNFSEESEKLISRLDADWDIILWGNNSDTTLKFNLLPGITPCIATFSQSAVRKGIQSFSAMTVEALPFRLDHTFGICGYAISPKGARRLLEKCLPLRAELVQYDSLGGRSLFVRLLII